MTLLRGKVSLRRSIEYRVIAPSRRKASPIVRINPHACSAHTPQPPCGLLDIVL